MTHSKRIYLAGPEVNFSAEERKAIVAERKPLLLDHGFEGMDPLNADLVVASLRRKRPVITATFQVKCSGAA